MVRRLVVVALIVLLALPAMASALSVSEVARDLRCPTCNSPLDVSNAPAAIDMKRFISQRIDAGWDKQRIIDALVDDFGEGVLSTPPKKGFNLVAWVVPIVVLLLGVLAVPFITRAWARRRSDTDPEGPDLSPEDAARVEQELRQLDG